MVEYFIAHALWIFYELLAVLLLCDELYVGGPLLILAGFRVSRVVLKLGEL